jgi:site-specific DNA recombinase
MRKRAALMSRVSSDEQAKGYSLGVQSEALENYCLRNDIEIVYSFREDHSAKSFERPEFKVFLEYLKKNSKRHRLVIVHFLG